MDTLHQAAQLLENGQVEEALELLKEANQHASDDEKYTIANLYAEWGFLDEAIAVLETLLKKYPTEGQLITELAGLYIELEQDEPAIHLLNDLPKDDPFYVQSLLLLADLFQAQGLFEVSEQKLLEAKQISPDEVVIDFALGELLFSIGQANRAINFYEKVLQQTDELNHILIKERLAESHAMFGHYELALQYYEELDSNDPDTLFKYGFIASQQKRNDKAIQAWKKLIELDPYYHTVYSELAAVMKEEGQTKEAYEMIKQGLLHDEYNKEMYLMAGQLAATVGDEAAAEDHLKQAVSLDHDYKDAVLFLIKLYENKQDFNQIIDLLTTIKASGAEDPIYHFELAKALREEERYKEALSAYQDAAVHLMHDSAFLKEYGYFLTEEGLLQEAVDVFTKYVTLEPLDEEVSAYIERLNFSINE